MAIANRVEVLSILCPRHDREEPGDGRYHALADPETHPMRFGPPHDWAPVLRLPKSQLTVGSPRRFAMSPPMNTPIRPPILISGTINAPAAAKPIYHSHPTSVKISGHASTSASENTNDARTRQGVHDPTTIHRVESKEPPLGWQVEVLPQTGLRKAKNRGQCGQVKSATSTVLISCAAKWCPFAEPPIERTGRPLMLPHCPMVSKRQTRGSHSRSPVC
jgi:hypothetical protein